MAVQGFSAGDFMKLAGFAWDVYTNIRDSNKNFSKLDVDVECLMTSISSLDQKNIKDLIALYISEDEEESRGREVNALRASLNSAVMPFYELFMDSRRLFRNQQPSSQNSMSNGIGFWRNGNQTPSFDRRAIRPWKTWSVPCWIEKLKIVFNVKNMEELRSRYILHSINLNSFLNKLNLFQAQRHLSQIRDDCLAPFLPSDEVEFSDHKTKDLHAKVMKYVRYLRAGGKALEIPPIHIAAQVNMIFVKSPTKSRAQLFPERDMDLDDDARTKLRLARRRLEAGRRRKRNRGQGRSNMTKVK